MIEYRNDTPIYLQISEDILKKVARQELKTGDKLDSIREMAIKYKVNANTISKTMDYLMNMNLVVSKRGMGIYIVEDEELVEKIKFNYIKELVNNFIKDMKEMNYNIADIKKILEAIQ